jgi:eukaryotic-like serine/threonine-protein kinase
MSYERRQQIEDLFEVALERQTLERASFLESACAGDPELLTEVQALLAAHELAERLFAERPRAPAERIGAYGIVREIGRGGMGTVYLAERADGQYRRRVAIKLIATTDTEDPLHQRFLAERQILAGLDHPNIARLQDGGVTVDGRPYLVLDYVDGLPITTYCDRHRLGIEERLRLFVDVCAAVHHAHQNLVIHRDLKPSNILVTTSGEVRLLDFGIAKLLNPALSVAHAPVTQLDLRAMTPEYASPEQVRGDSITTATDIYSLGVLLYELLTGSPPYRLTTRSPAEILQAVCETDPERPSTRVGRAESVPAAAGAQQELTPARRSAERSTTVERLRRHLRGDLDGIVLMALRKEPGRRYASADLLRQDLLRFLEGQPILAHRGSRRYRLGKFVRRHRVEVIAAGLLLLSLLGGLGAALWQAGVAQREGERAEASRVQAERALVQSEEVTRFLMAMFEAADTDPAQHSDEVTARDLLRRGVARADDLAEHPDVQARLLEVIGQIYQRLGYNVEAKRLLGRAVQIRRRVLGPDAPELATSLTHLSRTHRNLNEMDDARRLVAEALAIRRRTLPPDHPDLATAVHEVGAVAPDNEQQEVLYREALGILQQTGADPERQVQLLHSLSTNVRRQGRLAEAVATDREALSLAEQLLGPDHFRTGYAMIHLADQVRDIEQDFAEAERLYRRGLELMSRHYGESHIELRHGLGSLAWLLSQQGNHEEAERLYRRLYAIRLAATGPDHPQLASYLNALAGALERQGRLEEAEAVSRQALELWRRLLGGRERAISVGLMRLASILNRQGRFEEADRLYQESLAIRQSLGFGQEVAAAEDRRAYGRALIGRGHFQRAEEQLLESLAVLQKAYPDTDHPNTQETKRALMVLYQAWGKPDLVERYHVPPGRFTPY